MSLEICRQVDADNPELLRTNTGATCHQFTLLVIEALRLHGYEAYLMCKSPGEGQYVPPGFEPRTVIGLDGKPYVCSGVSHDAIWYEGQQVDTIASANDGDEPIFNSNGEQIHGVSAWNPIPQQYWRLNNPPLTDGAPTPSPTPPPVVVPPAPISQPYPDEGSWWLWVFDVEVGKRYAQAGKPYPDNAMSFRWASRTAYDIGAGMTKEDSLAKHLKELEQALGI